jgi:hypothetical protein
LIRGKVAKSQENNTKIRVMLASGDPDQIMSGVTNQILSEKSEPI